MHKSEKIIPSFFFFSVCLYTLLILGVWQLNKNHIKKQNKINFSENLDNKPNIVDSLDNKFENFQFVNLKGFFLHKHTMYFEPRTYKGIRGYHKLVPFKVKEKIIMVNRGFTTIRENKKIFNEDSVKGIIIKFPAPSYFELENDLNNNTWYTLNIKDVSSFTGLNLENYLMYELVENSNSNLIGVLPNTVSETNHLQYALTWFFLATIMCIIFYIRFYNKN